MQGADLIDRYRGEFGGVELHFAAAEALQVGQARVCADGDVVGYAGADGFHHDEGVAGVGGGVRIQFLEFCSREDSRGVEAAGDVGLVDHGEELEVRTARPVAIGFSQVDVDQGFVLDGPHVVVLLSLVRR